MTEGSSPGQSAEFLDGLSLSETVRRALERAVAEARKGMPLQTGALLAALAKSDTQGEWGRIWPSYEGGADMLLAAAADTRSQDSGVSWHGTALSRDLLSALRLLALIAGKYEMDPVQPGAVALALTADPGSGAARYLSGLSGCSHPELLDRIQSDLLGTTLDGFSELSQRWALQQVAGGPGQVKKGHLLARQAAAAYCAWVAWLAIRAGLGGIMAAVIVPIAVLLSAMAALVAWLSGPSISGAARRWRIGVRPRFTDPGIMILLFLTGLGMVFVFSGRHRVPGLFLPALVLLGIIVAIVLAAGTLDIEPRSPGGPPVSPSAGLPPSDFRYRTLFGVSVGLAGIAGLIAWFMRQGLISLRRPAPGAHLVWQAGVLSWIKDQFATAFLGKSFDHPYWPLLVTATVAVGYYFCGLAAQLLLTRVGRKAGTWAAVSCTAGLVVVTVSYLPIVPGNAGKMLSHNRAAPSVIRYDEETINRLWDRCQAFEPAARGCPFAAAQTSDGNGGVLYAIALKATAGDSCAGSVVYFFDGEALITDTTRLPPGGMPAEAGLSSPNWGQFMVTWRVNPSANAICAQFGTAGTDTYVYTWDGTTIILAAGTPPRPPQAFPPGSSLRPAVPDYLVRLEYCGTLDIAADGSGPLVCADGRPSLAADRYYRQLHLKVMTLGPHAPPSEVETAACSDARHTNPTIESDGMQLAATEQGWPYSAVNLTAACGWPRTPTAMARPSEKSGWTAAELPVNATRAGWPALSCTSAYNCAVVGNFVDYSISRPTSTSLGFPPLLIEHGRSWRAAEPTLEPGPVGGLSSVACPSPTTCVAVGSIDGGSGGLLVIRSGSSVTAKTVPYPAGVRSIQTVGERIIQTTVGLSYVACAAPASCVAVGNYSEYVRTPHASFPGPDRGIIVTESGQRWDVGRAPLPANAGKNPTVTFYGLACPSVTHCLAIGTYIDSSGHQQGLVMTGSGSSWTASEAPVPNPSTNPVVFLQSVACPYVIHCMVVGSYTDSSGHSQGLLESGFGSHWAATEAPLPGNASADPSAGFGSISCPSASSCTVLGGYADSSGHSQGYLLTRSGSSWRTIEMPLPADAAADPQVTPVDLACPSPSACVVAGLYTDTTGHQQGLVVSGSISSWRAAETPVPAGASINPNVYLFALTCPAALKCTAIGQYTDSSGQTQGLALTQRGS